MQLPSKRAFASLLLGVGICVAATHAALRAQEPSAETLAAAADQPGHALGREEAPVRLVEFFSFSCSHCERFHREVFPSLKRQYVDQGKVLFVARDFPLNLAALKAAQGARCGGEDRYFELLDAVWADWDRWIEAPDTAAALSRLLVDNGIAPDVADGCLADGSELERQVLVEMKSAIDEFAVERTPTFMINGKRVVGSKSLDQMKAMIDSELSSAHEALP